MNHIAKLTTERRELLEQLRDARDMVAELEAYLLSSKFAGPDNDFVHVRTDLLPKISRVKGALITA
jgi:transcription elongation factor GreA-like protein